MHHLCPLITKRKSSCNINFMMSAQLLYVHAGAVHWNSQRPKHARKASFDKAHVQLSGPRRDVLGPPTRPHVIKKHVDGAGDGDQGLCQGLCEGPSYDHHEHRDILGGKVRKSDADEAVEEAERRRRGGYSSESKQVVIHDKDADFAGFQGDLDLDMVAHSRRAVAGTGDTGSASGSGSDGGPLGRLFGSFHTLNTRMAGVWVRITGHKPPNEYAFRTPMARGANRGAEHLHKCGFNHPEGPHACCCSGPIVRESECLDVSACIRNYAEKHSKIPNGCRGRNGDSDAAYSTSYGNLMEEDDLFVFQGEWSPPSPRNGAGALEGHSVEHMGNVVGYADINNKGYDSMNVYSGDGRLETPSKGWFDYSDCDGARTWRNRIDMIPSSSLSTSRNLHTYRRPSPRHLLSELFKSASEKSVSKSSDSAMMPQKDLIGNNESISGTQPARGGDVTDLPHLGKRSDPSANLHTACSQLDVNMADSCTYVDAALDSTSADDQV